MTVKKKQTRNRSNKVEDRFDRTNCLGMALQIKDENGSSPMTTDKVLETAQKFYNFVQNLKQEKE